MIVWIFKVKTKDEYVYDTLFDTKEDAIAYINRTGRVYLLPVRAELKLKLKEE